MTRPNASGRRPKGSRALLIAAAMGVLAAPAFAQETKPAPQPVGASPIVVQRVTDQFFVAPEYKLTDMNGRTGQLVGGTGGVLLQQTFLVGGSVYHLVDGPGDWELTYGGFVFGAQMPPERTIRFGARGLMGWGQASNIDTFNAYPSPMPYMTGNFTMTPIGFHNGRYGIYPPYPINSRMHVEEGFFVFEPQGDLLFALSDKIRFGVSGGYRWTSSSDYFQHAINGVTGTFMLQVGF